MICKYFVKPSDTQIVVQIWKSVPDLQICTMVRNGLPDLYHGFRSTHDTGIVAWDQDYNNIK